jgi:myo-inositol-1-phosphate synthase
MIKDFVPLSDLADLVFGGWDIFEDDMYAASINARVLERNTLDLIRPDLESLKPLPAVFDQQYVKRLKGTHVKTGQTKMDLAEQLRRDIQNFKKASNEGVCCQLSVVDWKWFLNLVSQFYHPNLCIQ